MTETGKKLDTENFRMIVEVVLRIYKKIIGGRAFLPLVSTNRVKIILVAERIT